jgi:hypothetical protein
MLVLCVLVPCMLLSTFAAAMHAAGNILSSYVADGFALLHVAVLHADYAIDWYPNTAMSADFVCFAACCCDFCRTLPLSAPPPAVPSA